MPARHLQSKLSKTSGHLNSACNSLYSVPVSQISFGGEHEQKKQMAAGLSYGFHLQDLRPKVKDCERLMKLKDYAQSLGLRVETNQYNQLVFKDNKTDKILATHFCL
jgi:hypothetical protein